MTWLWVAVAILLAFNVLAGFAGEWRFVGATVALTVVCGGWMLLLMGLDGAL